MNKFDKDNFIGRFQIKSYKIIISDPIFPLGTWCSLCLPGDIGSWDAFLNQKNLSEWGLRNTCLAVISSDYQSIVKSLTWTPAEQKVCSDSSQVGIFDISGYHHDDEKWQTMCYEISHSKEGGGVLENGVVVASGIGDGEFDVKLAKLEGKIIGVQIVFI